MINKVKIILLDVDGTLLNCDSTKFFIQFYLKKNKNYFKLIKFYWFKFLDEFGLISDLKSVVLKLLKDEPVSKIENLSKECAEILIKKFLNEDFYLHIHNKIINENYKLILLSAAIHPIVKNLAHQLGGCGFGSFLLINENGYFTGVIKDIKGKKQENFYLIEQTIGPIDYDNSSCFSNNEEDLELLKKFNNSYGIITNKIQKNFWEIHKIKTFWINPKLTINYKLLFLPLFFYIYSRRNYRSIRLISIYYLLLPFLGVLILKEKIFILQDISIFLLGFFSYFSIYEIGVLFNDLWIIFKEQAPTIRVDKKLKDKLGILISFRLLFFFLAIAILYYLSSFNVNINLTRFLIIVLFMYLIFLVHNLIYKFEKFKILTIPLLKLFTYIAPMSIFHINLKYPLIFYSITLLPQHVIDFYFNKSLKKQKPFYEDVFIYKFFIIVAILCGFLYLIFRNKIYLYFLISNFILIIIKGGKIFKNLKANFTFFIL